MNKQNRELQAYVGYLVDIFRIATFRFSNPHSYTKFLAIKNLQKQTNAKVFIETGTYLGVTTNRCAPLFDRVYTIELDSELAEKASLFLAKWSYVKVIQADATVALKELFEAEDFKDALLFLDGHASGGGNSLWGSTWTDN